MTFSVLSSSSYVDWLVFKENPKLAFEELQFLALLCYILSALEFWLNAKDSGNYRFSFNFKKTQTHVLAWWIHVHSFMFSFILFGMFLTCLFCMLISLHVDVFSILLLHDEWFFSVFLFSTPKISFYLSVDFYLVCGSLSPWSPVMFSAACCCV